MRVAINSGSYYTPQASNTHGRIDPMMHFLFGAWLWAQILSFYLPLAIFGCAMVFWSAQWCWKRLTVRA